mmetsp:Transcript_63520/g.149172  ORF Transcript_63520/g.149172 Transcript_63520/m.149172 type:complete len:270 (+) Transcript_63520:344-1153(+)
MMLEVVDVLAPGDLQAAWRGAGDPKVHSLGPGQAHGFLRDPRVQGPSARHKGKHGHGQHGSHELPPDVKSSHIRATMKDRQGPEHPGGIQRGAGVLATGARAAEQGQAYGKGGVAPVPGLGHAAGIDAGDEGEGHDALPAEDLPVSHVLVDGRLAREAAGPTLPRPHKVPGARDQPGGQRSPCDGANDLEQDVEDGVDQRVEAANRGAEAHGRIQVAPADVRGHVDPDRQGEAIHERSQGRIRGPSDDLEEHHPYKLHNQGDDKLEGED